MIELFKVTCSGWHNCLDVQNDRLRYIYHVSAHNKTDTLPIYSETNMTVRLFFPVGPAYDQYRNVLKVVVSNYANYTEPFTAYPVTVSYTLTDRQTDRHTPCFYQLIYLSSLYTAALTLARSFAPTLPFASDVSRAAGTQCDHYCDITLEAR